MQFVKTLFTAALIASSVSAFAADYTINGNYVTIPVKQPAADGAKMVRLQVINKGIVRVEATPTNAFGQRKSLVVLPQSEFTDFQVKESDGSTVTIQTTDLFVNVNTTTGRVEFFDKNHKSLLSELPDGKGKTFKPYYVPDREIGVDSRLSEAQRHGWTWHAEFASPDDEAFYGLGQHQSEELNMKGNNEDLFQYNTKVSVPFVVSNKNYGVLWDSYSFSRFGKPDDYLQLNRAFTLYDKNGKKGALTGTYVQKDGKTVVRDEDSVYYEFALPDIAARGLSDVGVGNLPKGFNLDGSHVTYEGYIEAPTNNFYRFILYYAGYL